MEGVSNEQKSQKTGEMEKRRDNVIELTLAGKSTRARGNLMGDAADVQPLNGAGPCGPEMGQAGFNTDLYY